MQVLGGGWVILMKQVPLYGTWSGPLEEITLRVEALAISGAAPVAAGSSHISDFIARNVPIDWF